MSRITKAIKHKNQLLREHYTADAVVVWCFDDRFSEALENLKSIMDFTRIDLVKIAGGAKSISNPEKLADKDFVLRQIEKSINLHHTKRIILMVHEECGAYGDATKFMILDDLVKAKNVVADFAPVSAKKIPVETVFVDFETFKFVEED